MPQKRTQQRTRRTTERKTSEKQQVRLSRQQQREDQANKADWRRSSFPMWGRTLIAVAVVLLLMLVFFRVSEFEVTGNVRYTAEEVADASGITEGDVLMGVSKTQAASRILTKLPYVKQVVVTKLLPGTVRFEIVECTAAVMAPSEYGSDWLLTLEGKLLEEPDEAAKSAYPVITGTVLEMPTAGDQAVFADAEKGAMAMKVLMAVDAAGLTAEVQIIDVTDLDQVTITYQNRLEVQLGDGSDLDYKLQYMLQAAQQLKAEDRGILDLSFAAGSRAVFHPIR